MGTRWSPHDSRAQEKYRKGKANAEAVVARARLQNQAQELAAESVGKSTAVST